MKKEQLIGCVILNTAENRKQNQKFWANVVQDSKSFGFSSYGNSLDIYYGLDNEGHFNNYSKELIDRYNFKIINLPNQIIEIWD